MEYHIHKEKKTHKHENRRTEPRSSGRTEGRKVEEKIKALPSSLLAGKERLSKNLLFERLKAGWFHEPCFIKYAKGHRVLLAQTEQLTLWLVLS